MKYLLMLTAIALSGCTIIYKSQDVSVQVPTVVMGSGMDEVKESE